MFFPGYPVDVAVLVFLIFIHWIVFYPVDSANNHNQTWQASHLAGKAVSPVFKVIGMVKKIFVGLPVASHRDMSFLCCKRAN